MKALDSLTKAVVYAETPTLSGHPEVVGFKVTCPFAPYIRPHTFRLEIVHEEWVAMLRKKCGVRVTPPDVESGRVEKGWEPYQQILLDEHHMELTIRCPFCGKDFVAIVELPDWSRNIVLAALADQKGTPPGWPDALGVKMADVEAEKASKHHNQQGTQP
jgi:hypothetical protein